MLSPRESAAPGLKKGGAPEEVEDKTKHRGKQKKMIKIHISFHQIITLALLNINDGEVCEQEAFMIKT